MLVKTFKRKPTTVAKLLNISRATVYRYIQNSQYIGLCYSQQGGYIGVPPCINMKKNLQKIMNKKSARKKLEWARKKRNQRKTLYPFGFEYNKERK